MQIFRKAGAKYDGTKLKLEPEIKDEITKVASWQKSMFIYLFLFFLSDPYLI